MTTSTIILRLHTNHNHAHHAPAYWPARATWVSNYEGLSAEQWHNIARWLMWCLMAHYAVDGVVLLFTIILVKENTPLNRVRSLFWIFNNLIFFVLFAFHDNDVQYVWLLWALFWNCVAAVVITAISPLLALATVKWGIFEQDIQRSGLDPHNDSTALSASAGSPHAAG